MELSNLTTAQMMAAYNNLTGASIKKFESKAVALKRIDMAIRDRFADASCVTFDPATLTFFAGEAKAGKRMGKKLGIGKRMAEIIRGREIELGASVKDNTQFVLDIIHAEFPESRATSADVSIIRSKVKRGIM